MEVIDFTPLGNEYVIFNGRYKIDRLGQVFGSKLLKQMNFGNKENPYKTIAVNAGKIHRLICVSVLVAITFHPEGKWRHPTELSLLFCDNNRSNNRAENIAWKDKNSEPAEPINYGVIEINYETNEIISAPKDLIEIWKIHETVPIRHPLVC